MEYHGKKDLAATRTVLLRKNAQLSFRGFQFSVALFLLGLEANGRLTRKPPFEGNECGRRRSLSPSPSIRCPGSLEGLRRTENPSLTMSSYMNQAGFLP